MRVFIENGFKTGYVASILRSQAQLARQSILQCRDAYAEFWQYMHGTETLNVFTRRYEKRTNINQL